MADDPISLEYFDFMNKLASGLDDLLNPSGERKAGFALFMFDLDKPTRVNYISNAERDSMMEAITEWLVRSGGGAVQ